MKSSGQRARRARRAFAAALFVVALSCGRPPELPVLYPVPAVTLVGERGEPVALDSMRGNVAIYDFIFTRCGATCPMMTRAMQRLTREFPPDAPIRFVSITVDPEYDTPQVLAQYAAEHRNDPRWSFLTGDRDAVIGLSVDGFKLAAGDPMEGLEPLLHSTRFVLVDRRGDVRGYYDSLDGDAMKQLVADAKALLGG
ncbi:MAG TPA: SCO family protein [Thermoanaerobaculia bacterium]|nr:SCO family protein [Thermoanaerobaculia bacterium]